MSNQLEPARRADAIRNRAAVLDAAVRVLAENPAASMQEIADASGVGRTTVYRHFPTRDDLIRALFAQVLDESHAMSAAIAARGLPLREALYELAREIVDIGERYRFMQGHHDVRDEMIAAAAADYDDPFDAWLTEAQKRGEVRGDMPIAWLRAMLRGQATAAIDLVNAGAFDRRQTCELLGASLVSVFAPRLASPQ